MGFDTDYFFRYPTVKFVEIQDRRLGMLKYFLTFLIVLYVSIIQLWKNGGYLDQEKVSGVQRFTLQQPTVDNCSPSDDWCSNSFSNVEDLPYCNQSSLPYPSGLKATCQYYENVGVQNIFESSIAVATRIVETHEELVCDYTYQTSCPRVYSPNTAIPTSIYYPVDIERFTVLFDTSVFATSLGVGGEGRGESANMMGMVFVERNNVLCSSDASAVKSFGYKDYTNAAPCYILPNQTKASLDYFSIDMLLQAADTSLDATSELTGNTYRYDGATLIIEVSYTNNRSWKGVSNDITYTYTPRLLGYTSFKIYDPVYTGNSSNYRSKRTLLNKHSLKIDLVLTGNLYAFSFQMLLVSLTTSLTLLAMASVLTDYIALYLLPDKKRYNDAKYELTEDFRPTSRRGDEDEDEERDNSSNALNSPLIDPEEHLLIYGESSITSSNLIDRSSGRG
jgi:hypothetical protein